MVPSGSYGPSDIFFYTLQTREVSQTMEGPAPRPPIPPPRQRRTEALEACTALQWATESQEGEPAATPGQGTPAGSNDSPESVLTTALRAADAAFWGADASPLLFSPLLRSESAPGIAPAAAPGMAMPSLFALNQPLSPSASSPPAAAEAPPPPPATPAPAGSLVGFKVVDNAAFDFATVDGEETDPVRPPLVAPLPCRQCPRC